MKEGFETYNTRFSGDGDGEANTRKIYASMEAA
jgi:hypothetical protein